MESAVLESATSESAVVFSWPRTNEILTTTEEELYALAASERYGTFGYLFFGHSDFGPWGVESRADVLYRHGISPQSFRILRSVVNRDGHSDEESASKVWTQQQLRTASQELASIGQWKALDDQIQPNEGQKFKFPKSILANRTSTNECKELLQFLTECGYTLESETPSEYTYKRANVVEMESTAKRAKQEQSSSETR
tara:strand:- start:154 stop:747 length:594 start_codon:yes stop_codon:yes gene_type:complete